MDPAEAEEKVMEAVRTAPDGAGCGFDPPGLEGAVAVPERETPHPVRREDPARLSTCPIAFRRVREGGTGTGSLLLGDWPGGLVRIGQAWVRGGGEVFHVEHSGGLTEEK